ncbi:MAG: DHHA1 domain-containing protein, partial [Candidatus Micrarchaeota archaeon]
VQFLEYSDDPYIPGISYREDKAIALLQSLGIESKSDGKWRKYADLDAAEKKKLVSALADILVERNKIKSAAELIGESYVFPKRAMDETYEASEFATLLNACGRHDKDDVAVGVALGQEEYFDEARSLLLQHRKMLRDGIEFAMKNIQDLGAFFLLDGRGVIDEGIVGIVCGMVQQNSWKKPIVGVANGENGQLKLSGRGKGVNLGQAMKAASAAVKGVGGGHRMAAGAAIAAATLDDFLLALGQELGK